MTSAPFRLAVPQDDLDRLARGLARTRWPNQPADAGWRFGTELATLQKLLAHWRDVYDWRHHEARINTLPHRVVEIAGQRIHFLHWPGKGPAPRPLLLTHGWPGSLLDYAEVGPLLADPEAAGGDPADAFDVVAAALPGFPCSLPLARPLPPRAIARLWHTLMTGALGYRRFVAHGGDWGSAVSSWLALDHPESLAGLHLTMLPLKPWLGAGAPPLSEAESAFLAAMRRWTREEIGYQAILSTKPQTLAFGLADSPVGLAGWLVEKIRTLADTGGHLERRFSKDQLCTWLSLHWLSGAAATAGWIFYAAREAGEVGLAAGQRVRVPTGYADYPLAGAPRPPRAWAERMYDIVHWQEMASGGHFAAMEEPAAFAADLRAFCRNL